MTYWVLEFVKVLIGYIFLMYVWPSVVFRKILSRKSLTHRFAFCSTISVLLINTLVLGLGLFHILNRWIVFFIFHGIFLASILKKEQLWMHMSRQTKNLLVGTLGWKSFLVTLIENIKKLIAAFFTS